MTPPRPEALADDIGGGAMAPPQGALQPWANVTSLADRPDLRVTNPKVGSNAVIVAPSVAVPFVL